MKSIGAMVKQIAGLEGTDDVTKWENEFLVNIYARTANGEYTAGLSTKQVEIVERIYKKHFGDA